MKYYTLHPSPIGDLLLTSDGEALTGVYMEPHKLEGVAGLEPSEAAAFVPAPDGGLESRPDWRREDAPFRATRDRLDAYFTGKRITFDDLPLRPSGTPFQRRVWRALRTIPYGETATYGEMARKIGRPKAVRAVGAANGRNPIPIIVPCHRVIGADGSLTGYGGGMDRKRRLLDLEAGVASLL